MQSPLRAAASLSEISRSSNVPAAHLVLTASTITRSVTCQGRRHAQGHAEPVADGLQGADLPPTCLRTSNRGGGGGTSGEDTAGDPPGEAASPGRVKGRAVDRRVRKRGVLPGGSPPPWTMFASIEGTWGVRDANGRTVAARLTEVDARLVAQAPQMFKVLDRLGRHLRRVAPEGLLISEWSEIGADAIELVEGLRRQEDGRPMPEP